MVWNWSWVLRIPFEWFIFASEWFEWFECGFESFQSLLNSLNLHSKTSNPFRTVQICIRMLWIPFEWFEFAFKRLESLSKGSKFPFLMVWNWSRKLWVSFEWFNFTFECFESLSNGSNLHWNVSNPFEMVQMWFRKLRFQLRKVRNWIWKLRIPFEWFEFGVESFESLSNA